MGDILAADARGDCLLDVADGEPIARGLGAVNFHVYVEAFGNALREDGTHLGECQENLLNLGADLLNAIHVRPLNLHPHRRLDPGQFHVQPALNRHGPGIREAGKLKFLIHLLNQFFVGHSGAPPLAWLQHDRGVVHGQIGIVGGAFGTSDGPENAFNLGEGTDDPVLFLQ